MSNDVTAASRILDAAAQIIVDGGFSSISAERIAAVAGVPAEHIAAEFGSLPEALVTMLNREFTSIYVSIVDNIERDPQGGLLSRIYYYTLASTYERPLARALYTSDPDAMASIMRSANRYGYVPGVGIRSEFIEQMQAAGMVRRDVDAGTVSRMITVFSAGLAITAPHDDLDRIVRGVMDIIARVVDVDVADTTAGKRAFYAWAMSLTNAR